MENKFERVKQFLLDMDVKIVEENPSEELVVVEDEDRGIKNLIIDCEAPIVILEQFVMEVPRQPADLFKKLLQWNRQLVHGAFVMDEEGKYIFFRDTLQLEHLDFNELEASIEALSLAMAEFGPRLLDYMKN